MSTSRNARRRPRVIVILAAVAALASLAATGPALAYERYNDGCQSCHGSFTGGTSPKSPPTVFPGNDKHRMHRSSSYMNADCDLCHSTGDGNDPFIGSSDGTPNNPGLGCTGCHEARGLRLHHTTAGENDCVSCHGSEPAPPPESTPPPYYGVAADSNVAEPCNPVAQAGLNENWSEGDFLGQDNDGDGLYDGADPDCQPAVCGNGVVEAGEDCDDGNTADGDCCSSVCAFESVGSPCDDGVFCNVGETCDGAGSCGGGAARDCGDGVACTVDSCDEAADTCLHAPDDASCDDGAFCNGPEVCDPAQDCVAGTPVDCDDADVCTDDSCNEVSDQCDNVFDSTNAPECAVCGNGIVDPGEDCDDGNTADGDCCSSTCAFEPSGAACDDGLFCNDGETCDGIGSCGGGGARDCGDGVGCTTDTCDETADTCVNAPNDAACDDGFFCTGVETCDAVQDCLPGTAVDCDDADICTDDSCNETTDVCDNVFDPTNAPECQGEVCGNGVVEVGEDCDDGNTADGDCCSSTCLFEGAGSPCDDGAFCNDGETCDGAGSCGGGAPRDCDDGVGCTADSCDETGDACVNAPSDAACDDGLFCNGPETCDAVLDCRAGTPVDCDDADVCTDDSCNEATDVCDNVFDPFNAPECATCGNGVVEPGEDCDDGNTADGDCCSSVCTFEPSGQACSDGLYCNVGETCDGAGTCAGGGPRDCGDGVACTSDSCDEAADACVNTADDTACDDGLFCNGSETCDPALDCQAGTPVDCDDGDVCTDDACDETNDRCDNVFDATNAPDCLCVDADGDGFFPAGGTCGPFDCDDDDATLPGETEVCGDHKDNDCNGFVDAADAACDAPETWSIRSGPLANPAYAGSAACGECHAGHFQAWRDTLHARLLLAPGDAQAAGYPLPDAGSLPGAEVNLQTWQDVLFVVGQKWKAQYVDRGGNVQGIQWNFAQGGWATHAAGPYDCGRCHTTGFDPAATYLDDQDRPVVGIDGSWVEFNVGCEACHGPGAEHATAPAADNINRIELDWTPTGEGVLTPSIRSAEVCGQCHYGGSTHYGIAGPGRQNHEQFNDWSVSGHASSLQPSGVNTYCAKCHSPGNADAFAEEHYFEAFDPKDATHVTCISCHDPHATSHPRWAMLQWPTDGLQSPKDYPASIARYRGTDGNQATRDHVPFDQGAGSALCIDCHTLQPGYRRHVDASAPETVTLAPPFNQDLPFVVPHRQHFTADDESGEVDAECVDCHMPYSRRSINAADVRSHSLLPNDWPVGGGLHFDETCGQCHEQARDCAWCHSDFDLGGGTGEGPGSDPGWVRSNREHQVPDPVRQRIEQWLERMRLRRQ